jgi:carboxylesterase type B
MRRPLLLAVAVLAFATTACYPWVKPSGDAPLRYRDQVFAANTVTSNIEYGTAVDQLGNTVSLKMDVYRPTGDSVTSRPAIVWVHGGSFCCGNKTSPEIVDEAQTFARQGFVSASISYRLHPSGCSAGGPTATCVTAIQQAAEDARTAIRYLRTNASTYGIDTTRIAIAGTSAGAISAMNVAFDVPNAESSVRAAVSLSGAKIFGSAGPGDAATLLFHGTADVVVPYQWAVNTNNEAKAANLHSFLISWDGAGHVPYAQNRAQILDHQTNFFWWEMDLAHAAK